MVVIQNQREEAFDEQRAREPRLHGPGRHFSFSRLTLVVANCIILVLLAGLDSRFIVSKPKHCCAQCVQALEAGST